MNQSLIELHTFPSIAYCQAMTNDLVILEAQENYNKRSFRNKYEIVNDKGRQTLSIPLQKGKHQQLGIREVLISYDENWPDIHQRTLATCYRSSPFFDFYFDDIQSLLHSNEKYLWKFNFNIIQWLIQTIRLPSSLASSTTFRRPSGKQFDYRYKYLPKQLLEHKPYPQVFEDRIGFQSNLSILDLLFALGPETLNFLISSHMSCKLNNG